MWQNLWEINGNHALVIWKFGPNGSKLDTTKRLGASSSHHHSPRPQPNSSLATNDWPCKSMVKLCIIVLKKPFGTIRHSFYLSFIAIDLTWRNCGLLGLVFSNANWHVNAKSRGPITIKPTLYKQSIKKQGSPCTIFETAAQVGPGETCGIQWYNVS